MSSYIINKLLEEYYNIMISYSIEDNIEHVVKKESNLLIVESEKGRFIKYIKL